MKKLFSPAPGILLLLVLNFSCKKSRTVQEEITIVAAGTNVTVAVDSFRKLLGEPLNTTVNAIGGRREIDWEGVPDAFLGKPLPLDFFNPTAVGAPPSRQRGLTYAPGGEFRVSDANFFDVNTNTTGQFLPFSGNKTFANISSNAWEIIIEKPGEKIAATVRGFGIVFSDVDTEGSTSVEFFNGVKSLGKYFVPANAPGSRHSFLGLYFNNQERIGRLKIRHEGPLAAGQKDVSDSGPHDLVVMDDLLYSEPQVKR